DGRGRQQGRQEQEGKTGTQAHGGRTSYGQECQWYAAAPRGAKAAGPVAILPRPSTEPEREPSHFPEPAGRPAAAPSQGPVRLLHDRDVGTILLLRLEGPAVPVPDPAPPVQRLQRLPAAGHLCRPGIYPAPA